MAPIEIIDSGSRMTSLARELRAQGRRVGLVPTMGALHDGHLSLMRLARERCDTTVVSVFVNPTQFGQHDDFERYPRDLTRDADLAMTCGVEFVFAPTVADVYPDGASTYVTVEGLSEKLEGAARPGHFRGVTTVVTKLFNLVQPHCAVFGRKDAQQVIVVKKMVRDLAMDVEIVAGPTVRDPDGLALSSRNVHLSPEERRAATVLYRALEHGRRAYDGGENDAARLIATMRKVLDAEPLARPEYVAITDTLRVDPLETIPAGRPTLVSLAVGVGATRLIDNIVLNGDL